MDSYTAQADAIRSAITSASTCTPAISASLKELLQERQGRDDEPSKPPRSISQKATRVANKTKPPTTKATKKGTRNTSTPAQTTDVCDDTGVWGPKEKASLATKVVNATLKALGEAAKAAPVLNPAPSSTTSDATNPTARTRLRRSTSVPMTPLKPRALNRVSSTPVAAKTNSLPTTASTGCLSLAECARVAFATLRSLQDSAAIRLPKLQLESGMSALISKLIILNLHDHAVKESRILKRRLESMIIGDEHKKKNTSANSTNAPPKTLSDLLDYPPGPYSEPLLSFIINTQLQTLRMFHELKRVTTLEAILPFLRPNNPSSPLSLLLARAQSEEPERLKIAKQLEALSQTLLHLTPSLATKEDKAAQEPRLNPSPAVALEAQTLGLITRLESWKISGQMGDINKDILFPLSRCLVAFWRRVLPEHGPRLIAAFRQVWEKIHEYGFQITPSCKESLAPIYQLAVMAAQESGNSKEAKHWGSRLNGLMSPDEDSVAKRCAATAQLLALSLKDSIKVDKELMTQVLDGMQGTLSGSIAELDDLLVNLCLLRKAVCNIITKQPSSTKELTEEQQLLGTFINQLPRFALRWLGKPPSSDSATKDLLRFEQRRQLLSKYQRQILDAALLLTKTQMDEDRLTWEAMDALLQDCLLLLEYIDGLGQPSFESNPAASYHVKISHLYFQQHSAFRKLASEDAEASSLRALKRSIDSLKERSEVEQTRGLLLKKWEIFVEVCKASNRKNDAINALRSIRDHLVRCDTVAAITSSLASEPLKKSWRLNPDTELLSRTVCNLAKLERKARDWTWLLTGEDKATALEHDLHFILMESSQGLDNSDSTVINLLQSYSIEQYPIRRLRSLLALLVANIDSNTQVDTLRADVDQVLIKLEDEDLGKDARLARYLPYLRHLAGCLFGMACGKFESENIQRAVSGWKRIISNCQTASQLADRVDDPQQLLRTLQSLVDLGRMKGFQSLSTDIMELSTKVSQLTIDDNIELHILHSSSLFLQYVTLGQSAKAEKLLQSTMDSVNLPEVSSEIASNFHLSAAEYHLAVGCYDKAEKHLSEARDAVLAAANQNQRRWRQVNRKIAIAYASFLTSNLCLERGENHRALKLAKTAVKILFNDWSQLEQCRNSTPDVIGEGLSQTDSLEEDSSFNSSRMSDIDIARANTGPEFWVLVHPLYRFTQQLSSTYAHLGMYQETAYYAEQAQKIAESMGSSYYLAQATTWMASVSLMAGDSAKSVVLLGNIRPLLLASEPSSETVTALCQAASVYREAEEEDCGATLLQSAESMLQDLESKPVEGEGTAEDGSQTRPTKALLKEATLPLRLATRATRATKLTTKSGSVPTRVPTRRAGAKEVKAPVKLIKVAREEDALLRSLQASILHSRSLALIKSQDWTAAITALRSAAQLSKLPLDLLQQHFVLGMSLIGQSLQQMETDSVFSFIQDSTLSFPSVAMASRDKGSHAQALIRPASPARKAHSSEHEKQGFVQNLHDAEEHLLEAHSIATRNGNGVLVHKIAAALQKVAVLLSNTSSLGNGTSHPAHATCSIELARNLTWRRERKANRCDATKDTKAAWPMVIDSQSPRRSSLGFSIDMTRFQREYVDIIPKNWDVVSVSLSENKHDLCITKLQAGFSPFALRLPLERANSRDADTEIFDFQQGRSELLDIIQMANRTCHDARDMTQPEAKTAWWAEREELDERLKQLLSTIEEMWLGGFKGIFSQHHQRSDLLARFQKTFHVILDKYLPSRRQVRGRKVKTTPTRVNLDPRILELFVGLGDATAPDCDFDEPLTDLLYFVVDVLQFHGETNAYDEIDFDAMVIDTFDALHAYHSMAKERGEKQEGTHTILILDKSLHVFPWESLPCLEGLAVSRVPSLDCLRRSIMESKASTSSAGADNKNSTTESEQDSDTDASSGSSSSRTGHYVSTNSGTYILNPSADLTTTQATFGRALSSLPPAWQAIESRAPTEDEFQSALTTKDILLYFGHGSGAQYIRGRTIRQLEKCRAVALLMGCSSASLINAGDFELYGPVWNYMLAGSPAVVGTLWDVTDRDIDRFAAATFEEWGLMPRGTFAVASEKGSKGKGRATTASRGGSRKKGVDDAGRGRGRSRERTSLVEAVAKARTDACRFRYLTAAAVCVYGIPVYVE